MPSNPYPLDAKDFEELRRKLGIQLEELYENRVAGAIVGDVFNVGDDDILSLNVGAGLQKVDNEVSVKVRDGYGIVASASGIYLKRQVHEADASAVSAVTLTAGTDQVDIAACNSSLSTLVSQVNNAITTLNNLIVKLENAEIFASS